MLSLGALDLRSKPPSFLTGWGALFSNGLSGIWLGTKTLQYWTIKPGISAFLKKFLKKTNQIRQKIDVKSLGFKKKKKKAPRVSSLLQQLDQEKWAWHASLVEPRPYSRASSEKPSLLCMSMSLRASKKNRNRWSKEKLEWEKKKFRVNVQDRS